MSLGLSSLQEGRMMRPGVRSWLGRAGTPIAANPRMSEESVSVTPSRWVPPKTLFTTVPSLLQERQWWVSGGWDQTLTRTMQKYVTLALFLSLNLTSGSLRWTWCRETLFLFPEWSHWVSSPFLFFTNHLTVLICLLRMTGLTLFAGP